MFFGSAVTNFGVEPFLYRFLKYTQRPLPRESDQGLVEPENENFSGFIFKIQANMNPAHRDRLAFLRVVSGVFEKGMTVWHSGTNKQVAAQAAPAVHGRRARGLWRTLQPGDIIGLFDPGIYQPGRHACALGSRSPRYENMPVFAPERFARVRPHGHHEAQAVR